MNKSLYTAALVGCGRIGYRLGLDSKREQPASHTMALNENPRIRLVAGCDVDAQTLCSWHNANPGAAIYRDSIQLYSNLKTDIVVVAVNESNHEKEAVDAIVSRPGLVILEKPVALNVNQAKKIQGMALRNNVPVMVNHERRFSTDYQIAKQLIKNIGPLQSIQATLSSGMAVYNPKEENTGAYSLIHDGTHLVDAVRFFLEDFVSEKTKCGGLMNRALKYADRKNLPNPILKKPIISGLLLDEKKCVRQLSAHYALDVCPEVTLTFSGRSRYFGFEIDIRGTEGRLLIGNGIFEFYGRKESNLYTGFYSLTPEKIVLPKKTGYFSNMVQSAVDFLDGKSVLKSDLQNGIDDLSVLEEIKNKLT